MRTLHRWSCPVILDRDGRRSLPSEALVGSLGDAVGKRRQGVSEFLAGADVKFREHLAQVVLDGARANEQLGAYLGVRLAICGESSDLRLLRGEGLACLVGSLARGFAGGQQLAPSALGERLGPDATEH